MSLKNRNKFMSLDGANELKASVVYRACQDYLSSGPHQRGLIKAWFLSDIFSFWCNIDGMTIIHRLDKMIEEGKTKLYNLYDENGSHQKPAL